MTQLGGTTSPPEPMQARRQTRLQKKYLILNSFERAAEAAYPDEHS